MLIAQILKEKTTYDVNKTKSPVMTRQRVNKNTSVIAVQ